MAWQDEMQPASFRGVRFFVKSSSGPLGRRNVVHEYPSKDEAYVQDMGKKARGFTLECFVIGNDYMAARDNLEAAFEKGGSGELVHPWRGRMNVSVTDCTASESIETLGLCSFSVTFTQTGINQQPSVRADTQSVVIAAADAAQQAVEADFAETFTVDALPEFVETDAVTQITDKLNNVLQLGRSMLPDISILPAFIANSSSVLGKLTQLMRLPTNLASEVSAQISALLGLGDSPLSAFNALKSLFGLSHTAGPRNTAARIQLDNNRKAVTNLTRRTAIITAAKASADMPFESQQQAYSVRDTLMDAIEAEQLTASDDVYAALADMRSALAADVAMRAGDLATLITYTPKATIPAILLAYQIYGDANKDLEIVARNNIAHQGFVPGGKPLEVLIG